MIVAHKYPRTGELTIVNAYISFLSYTR